MKTTMNCKALTVFASLAAALICGGAQAQWRPAKPVHVVMPFSPGGTAEAILRAVTEPLRDRLGQPVIIDSRPGGGQLVAAREVARSPADGYNILWASPSILTFPLLTNTKYDLLKEMVPVIHIGDSAIVVAVNSDVPAKSFQELVQFMKTNPGKINYGITGNGSPQHLTGELIKMRAGVDMTAVPYKGSSILLPDLLAGRVQMTVDGVTTLLPHASSGKIRILALTNGSRTKVMPGVPTLAESGLPGFNMAPWNGFLVPIGTPKEIITALNRETDAIVKTDAFAEQLGRTAGGIAKGGSPEQFAEVIRLDIEQYTRVIATTGIKAE